MLIEAFSDMPDDVEGGRGPTSIRLLKRNQTREWKTGDRCVNPVSAGLAQVVDYAHKLRTSRS